MKLLRTKRAVAVAVVGGLTIVGSGIAAFAYWTSTATGSGSAAATAGTNSLSFTQNTLAAMYPGDSAQAVTVTVKNTDANQKEYVTKVTAYLTVSATGTCDASDFLLDGFSTAVAATPVTLGWTAQELAAGGSAATTGDTIQFNDKPSTDQSGCKSAAVTIHYTAS